MEKRTITFFGSLAEEKSKEVRTGDLQNIGRYETQKVAWFNPYDLPDADTSHCFRRIIRINLGKQKGSGSLQIEGSGKYRVK